MGTIISLIIFTTCMASLLNTRTTKVMKRIKGKKKEYFAKETPSFTYEQLLTLLNNSDTQPKTNVIGLIIPFCSSCYIDQKLIENGSLIVISMTTWFCHLNYY